MGCEISWAKRRQIAAFDPDGPESVVALCRRLGVSRASFYRIRARYQAGGLDDLGPRSRARHHPPRPYAQEVGDAIELMAQDLASVGLDAAGTSIHHYLTATGMTPVPSVPTINRVLRRRGLTSPNTRKRPRASYKRFAMSAFNEMWQLDSFAHTLPDGTTASVYQVIDDATRVCVALRCHPGAECHQGAITTLSSAISTWGPPRNLLTDNGAAFNQHRSGRLSRTETWLASQGILPISGRPGHPRTQGKTERAHATARKWVHRAQPTSLDQLQACLDRFTHVYNHIRPHQAIGGVPPMSAWATWPHDTAERIPFDPHDLLTTRPTTHGVVRTRGSLSIHGLTIYVGAPHAGKNATLTINPNHTATLRIDDDYLATIDWPPPTTYVNASPNGPRTYTNRPTATKALSHM